MKNTTSLLLTIAFVFSVLQVLGQESNDDQANYISVINQERSAKDQLFSNPEESPLSPSDMETFESLKYYDVDESYRVTAQLTIFEDNVPVMLTTSKGGEKQVMKYGTIMFELKNKMYTLSVFQNSSFPEMSDNPNQLFVPFKDNSNGSETNSNGRYVELEISEGQNTVEIDFNRAYNPYTTYNNQYESVVPPDENGMQELFLTGERKYVDR